MFSTEHVDRRQQLARYAEQRAHETGRAYMVSAADSLPMRAMLDCPENRATLVELGEEIISLHPPRAKGVR